MAQKKPQVGAFHFVLRFNQASLLSSAGAAS